MENKFTKGQWAVEAGLQLNVTAGKNGFVIANVTKDGILKMIGNEAEGYANAKLIAAAPEMLWLLGWIVNEVETTPNELSDALLGLIKIRCNEAIKSATE